MTLYLISIGDLSTGRIYSREIVDQQGKFPATFVMITHIYIGKGMRNINPDKPIKNFRALHSFCTYNCLPSGRISKLQGGYYILNDELKWELISSTLDTLTFKELYKKLSKLSNVFEIQRERIEFLKEEIKRLTK